MKKSRKAGKKWTKWQSNGRRSKNWKGSWKEEGLKDVFFYILDAMQKVLALVVNERMSQGKG